MPIGDIAEGLFEFVFRIIKQILVELVFEILIKGPGYLLAKLFTFKRTKEIDPDSLWVVFLGLLFWAIVGFTIYSLFYSNGTVE